MTIRVALHHVTEYRYDRLINLGPQEVRLRPAPHCRTPVPGYSLKIEPADHFINWQQDPHGNFVARLSFTKPTRLFRVTVDLLAEMTVINPFDFFIEPAAEQFPFEYAPELAKDLVPFLERLPVGPALADYLKTIDTRPRKTVDFLVELNLKLQRDVSYLIRLEPGVQSPDETLTKKSGSCRDSAWLMVQILRSFGLAARFVSGYLIQLVADLKPLEGAAGATKDFTDLHAWAEVFLPGAGWIGLDPTSGLLTGEGHVPLAATPSPQTAAPISGCVEKCEVEFGFEMNITRAHEDPRVTKPYTDAQWEEIDRLGHVVDERLVRGDVRLTMGGEPTFVSIDDMESPEWNTGAVGLHKQRLSVELIQRLRTRFGPGGLLHFGQGKWYPGESLPRWAYTCLWRKDGEPIWSNSKWLAGGEPDSKLTVDRAGLFLTEVSRQLQVDPRWIQSAYEDVWKAIEQEHKLPLDVDARKFELDADEDRRRLAKIIEQGPTRKAGYVLPLTRAWWQARAGWASGPWPLRAERLFLLPGDSPIGLRLPLDSLPVGGPTSATMLYPIDPFADRQPLPGYAELRQGTLHGPLDFPEVTITEQARTPAGRKSDATDRDRTAAEAAATEAADAAKNVIDQPVGNWSDVVRTALCIEPRNGRLHVFMPPVATLEDYLELVATIEKTAEAMKQPVVLEGYLPPHDHRIQVMKVTPDPGVIEVNVHPAGSWEELKEITTGVYEEARLTRLGTEKFQLDGKHSGTGGGNHIVLGGPTPADSPFLRRPDLLRSLVSYWNNHPSLSYIFSGQFIGPTCQAPRVDEGRRDALYELELAFSQIPPQGWVPPWLVDRIFRHLLVDLTGNTHRAEFCIDKLYSPDHANGRLGLLEFRAFEMPPHARMSLTQQLLVRAFVAWFWDQPYRQPLARWGTALHDRFMLPHYLEADFRDVLRDLQRAGLTFREEWFAPHLEFRCPPIGAIVHDDVTLALRQAVEPWYVLGEEPGAGGTARYVDSSVERLEAKVTGFNAARFAVTCNGRKLPMQATGVPGEYVAGVRYRAWQPPSCLHPTIPVHAPLVFDIVDRWLSRSLGGCQYHVGHPGGLNPGSYPINTLEAESRRAGRFLKMGHTGGSLNVVDEVPPSDYPCTLDLRQPRN
jgi:uncharacterized protein (DUF2126 family)/transglutaminase-like putative cysteine protease